MNAHPRQDFALPELEEYTTREEVIEEAIEYARDHLEAYYDDIKRIFFLTDAEIDRIADETHAYRRRGC